MCYKAKIIKTVQCSQKTNRNRRENRHNLHIFGYQTYNKADTAGWWGKR